MVAETKSHVICVKVFVVLLCQIVGHDVQVGVSENERNAVWLQWYSLKKRVICTIRRLKHHPLLVQGAINVKSESRQDRMHVKKVEKSLV